MKLSLKNHQENTRAAQAWAQAFESDPFAYGRMKLHLDKGIEEAAVILEDAYRLMKARGVLPRV